MMPGFKAYLIKQKKIVDVREINYNLLEIGWIDDDFHDRVTSFDDIKFIQSTGLFDKNGKEIFEGDILKVFVLGDEGAIAKVIFKNGMFGIEDDMHGYGYDKGLYSLHQILSLRDAEILGNIYEHPHLLGED